MRRMKTGILYPLLLAASLGAAATPGDFRVVVDEPRGVRSEDAAVHGFTLLNQGAANAAAVGTVGRAFSLSSGEHNALWGVVTEAINFPGARGHLVGLEAAVVNMAHHNSGVVRGIDVVFKNRMDVSFVEPLPAVGENRFNDRSVALHVSSQPRSPAGEYSGWQAGIKFAAWSLDRSASVPYAVGIDFSEAEVPATFYLMVWRCGPVKCGLLPTAEGFAIVRDIDGAR
jgi:hypothetical protein